ncbi:MAG TPA: hypothetical protein V6C64_15910 [Microcoleaceae cyanobacterium]
MANSNVFSKRKFTESNADRNYFPISDTGITEKLLDLAIVLLVLRSYFL